ncbi:hypothetical protein BsWGS_24383 [Bradybaena similaris]
MSTGTFGDSSRYLLGNLKEILPRALNEVCQARPIDPIEYLAKYLYKAADCDLYFQEKAVFETQKRKLEIQLKQEDHQRQNAILRYKKQISHLQRCLHREGRRHTFDEQLATGTLVPKSVSSRPVRSDGKKDKRHETTGLLLETAPSADISRRSSRPGSSASGADISRRSSRPGSSASGADISRRSSRPGSSKKTSAKQSMMPLTEIRSVVSVQRDSQSSSRTQDVDLLERSRSSLTSSSRTTGKRLSASFGDEEDMKELLTISPKSQDTVEKEKRQGRGGGYKKESLKRGRIKKSKYISSSSEVLDDSESISSVSQLIGGLERVQKLKDEMRKSGHRRREKKGSAADDETVSKVIADDVTADDVKTDGESEDVASSVTEATESSLTEATEEEGEKEEIGKMSVTESVEEKEQIKKSSLTELDKEGEIKKISTAKKIRKQSRKTRDETIQEKSSVLTVQEATLETKTLPRPVKAAKKKRRGTDASLKAAATDQETQNLVEEPSMTTVPSIKETRSPSREPSPEYSAESDEDEMEPGEWEDLYEAYDTEDQPFPVGEVTGVDGAERARRPSVERKRKQKRASVAEADIEEERPKSEIESIPSDQKRKGKKRTGKRGAKSAEDDEAEQRQKRLSYDAVEGGVWEPVVGKKSKKRKSKQRKFISISAEDSEGVSRDEQEDERPSISITSKYSMMSGKKRKKGKSKGIKFTSFATEDGEEVSEDQEGTRRTSRRGSQALSREPSSEFQSSRRGSKGSTKSTGRKGKQARFRRQSRRSSRRSSISESERVSFQSSQQLIPDYAEAVDTSLGSSEIGRMEESAESLACPFTPVKCEWYLADSNTLVCWHPVLGEIRSRPYNFNMQSLNIIGMSDPVNYTWQAIYDHEMYTVKEPYLDDHKFKRKPKTT